MYHIQSIQSAITGSQSFGYVLDNTGAINPRQTHNINLSFYVQKKLF